VLYLATTEYVRTADLLLEGVLGWAHHPRTLLVLVLQLVLGYLAAVARMRLSTSIGCSLVLAESDEGDEVKMKRSGARPFIFMISGLIIKDGGLVSTSVR
jgi:hypothetical protein